MTESFDPYRDWLGLKGGGPGANYYRLLSVKLFEADSPTILAAADRAIARVEKIAAAEHADVRQRILAELTAAKLCLLNPAARAHYDARLRNRPPAPIGTKPRARPSSNSTPPAIYPTTPLPVAIPIARPVSALPPTSEVIAPGQVAVSASLWDDSDEIPRTLASAARNSSTWQSSLVVGLGFLLACGVLAAGGLAAWQFWGHDDRLPAVDGPPPAESAAGATDTDPPQPAPDKRTTSKQASGDFRPATDERRAPIVPVAGSDSAAARTPDPVDTDPHPTATVGQPAGGPVAQAGAGDSPSAASSQPFSRAVNRARAALVARELELARRHLDRAKQLAQSPAQHETIERLDALHSQLSRFVDAVRAGLPKFAAADELRFGDQVVAVIESGPDRLSLRVEGARRDYSPATLPAPIALIVARAGADENAAESRAFFGAFHAADPGGDRALARQLLQSAGAAGEPVEPLLSLLDPAELAVAREAVPEAELLAEAERHVAEKFAVPIKGARSAEQKTYLVDRLICAAAEADDAADQYALASEACARAAMAGDARLALRSVDELARWFDVDALALKTQTLAKTGGAVRDPDAARQVADAALALLDEAGPRDELRKTLALTAVAAARRTRDAELMKKAVERRREIERPARQPDKPAAGD